MRTALALFAICVIALLIRVVPPYDQVFRGDRVVFAGNDPWIHMRNADNIAAHWPFPSWFDPYRLAPEGQWTIEAPLMDVLISGVALLTGIPIDVAGAWFPAVAGALIPIPIFLLVRRSFGQPEAVIAAALIAILPGSLLQRSLLGFTDHHVLEALLASCVLLFLVREQPLRAGVFLGLYLLTWSRGTFLLLILIAWALIARQGKPVAKAFAIALLFAAPLAFHLPPARMSIPVLICGALAALAADRLPRVAVLLLGIALAVAGFFALPDLAEQAQRFMPAGAAATIGEVQPLLMSRGQFTLAPLWFELTTASILMVIGFVLVARDRTPQRVLLLVFTAIVTVASLAQYRFAYYMAIAAAVLASVAVVQLFWRGMNRAIGAIAMIALVFVPNVMPAMRAATAPQYGPGEEWLEALDWMRTRTPEPFGSSSEYLARHRSKSDSPPAEYGVMALSDYGWWLARIARRPPATNPTQTAVKESAQFYTATSEGEAMKILRERNARYVIVDRSLPMTIAGAGEVMSSQLEVLARWAEKKPSQFYELVYDRGQPMFVYYPDYYRTMAIRLFGYSGQSYLPSNSSWAIAVDEQNHVIASRRFLTYDEAASFVAQNGRQWKVVGLHPLISCVPLERLEAFTVIRTSSKHEVKIFSAW